MALANGCAMDGKAVEKLLLLIGGIYPTVLKSCDQVAQLSTQLLEVDGWRIRETAFDAQPWTDPGKPISLAFVLL